MTFLCSSFDQSVEEAPKHKTCFIGKKTNKQKKNIVFSGFVKSMMSSHDTR